MIQRKAKRQKAAEGPPKGAKRAIPLPPDNPAEAFKPVADLISSSSPSWLVEHLERWSSTIYMSHAVEWRQPSRAEVVKTLTEVRDAAALLKSVLDRPSVREFLDAGSSEPLNFSIKFQMILGELQIRADRASRLPNLVDSKGRTRTGRGRAQPDGAISAQTYCALFIAEAWKWVRGEYPAPRNPHAAEAVGRYWQLAGFEKQGWGNEPWKSWRYHLDRAAKTPATRERAEIQRHMRECARYADLLEPSAVLRPGK